MRRRINKKTEREGERQTNRQTERQTDRRTDKINILIYYTYYLHQLKENRIKI